MPGFPEIFAAPGLFWKTCGDSMRTACILGILTRIFFSKMEDFETAALVCERILEKTPQNYTASLGYAGVLPTEEITARLKR